MDAKISDFALANKALQLLCYTFDKEFIDIEIVFGEDGPEHRDGIFYLQENGSIQKTIFSIVFLYMQHMMSDSPEEERRNALMTILALVKDFKNDKYDYGFDKIDTNEVISMRLDQNPIVWIILKNIICPSKKKTCNNIRILSSKSSVVDVARLITEKEMPKSNLSESEFPFIFMNLDVESMAIRSAYLLVEATKAHFGNEAEAIVRDLFSNFFMKERMISFVKMIFVEDRDEADFFATLSILCQSPELEKLALEKRANSKSPLNKNSQAGGGEGSPAEGNQQNWWYMGLLEKFLEPARSEDWTVYENWKPFTDELWQRVETERRRRGLDEAPFELLLDVQRQMDELGTDATQTLQALLSDNRIW